MKTAIKVENIGKKYIIRHQQEQYLTLRDELSSNTRKIFLNVFKNFRDNPTAVPAKEEFWALKNISFTIKNSERIGIIGKNGAGKSTLLKILSRITEPSEGQAIINGRVSSLLEVGTGFHPELTGRENIYLNGAVLGMSKKDINAKFKDIVEFAEIDKFLDTPVKRYSSGMYVRLAFAVAANLEPEILIIDEVLAVGDANFQKKCLGKMDDVSKNEGRTILFVSHNMAAISSLTEKCILLNNGKMIAFGNTDKIVNMYLSTCMYDNLISKDGIYDYTNYKLHEAKINLKNAKALFINGKTSGNDNNTRTIFKEGETIVISIGFKVIKKISFLELAFGVKNMLDVPIFSVLSDIFQLDLKPGIYNTKIIIDPNYLRPGEYNVGFSMYAPDLQDGIRNAMHFTIEANSAIYNNPHWSFSFLGSVKLPYFWEEPVKIN
ncbi:MAG: ABC transporter ATP-binding protein [Actinobacteria bacterium]|nr:ABC transporter ATP-binding protein [Actinomycetota bacterium]